MSFGLPSTHVGATNESSIILQRVMIENLTHHSLWAFFRCPASPPHSWRCWWLPECRWLLEVHQAAEGLHWMVGTKHAINGHIFLVMSYGNPWVEMRNISGLLFVLQQLSLCFRCRVFLLITKNRFRLCSSQEMSWWDFVWTEKVLGFQNHFKIIIVTWLSGLQIVWLTDRTLDRNLQGYPAFCLFCPRVDTLAFGFPFGFGLLPVAPDAVEVTSRLTIAVWSEAEAGDCPGLFERDHMISVG